MKRTVTNLHVSYTYWCQLGSLETHQLYCMYSLLMYNIINDLNYVAYNSENLSTCFRKIEYTQSAFRGSKLSTVG